jgi:hypothetical protein
MTYELAKQLKNAGFPQHDKDWHQKSCYGDACSVDLSELIEACGEAFDCLILDRDTKKWRVSWWYEHLNTDEPDKILESTPEEAVAKLYLSLHGHH